ncbi:hypothetical protein MAM1_0035c02642 [Mucor ambiguus]|uniref:Galactose oxidase n=1 Tax=Mucor ambiguus TaxID=91626 RepID=A0A0C9M2X6_9FUNG|nr:hypothetical protein MAM1_0035c02642 [Mucor ambiguus]
MPTSDHYSLDLTRDFSVANSIESWNSVVPVGDFTVEPNSLFSIVPLNDSYLIHGGLGYGSSTQHLKNTTVIYHTSNNSWSALQTQNQTLMMPSDNTTAININKTTYHDEFQVLDLKALAWSFPDNDTKTSFHHTSAPSPRLAHTATLSASGQSIYYIGGLQVDDSGTSLSGAPMNEILEYNITSGNWTTHTSPANTTIPAPRRLHTATLIPNSDLLFVYGGSITDASDAVADYSYLLNTTSFIWTPVNIANTNIGAGSRFGHSAVLYNDRSLFIIFGADDLGMLRNDFAVIDIVHWQWVSDFKSNGNYANTATATSSSSANPTASTSIVNTNSNSEKSSSTQTNEFPFISLNYMKTGEGHDRIDSSDRGMPDLWASYVVKTGLDIYDEGSLEWFSVHNVLAAFFERKFRASTIQKTVAFETTIKLLGHTNNLLDIATNHSFKDENEGDAVDSKANNNGTTNAVEAKVINGHAEQELIYQMMLPYL